MGTRNLGLERSWIGEAGRGLDERFTSHVHRRLAMGDQMYGDRWQALGLERLLTEITEEAADLGAWAVLALQALDLTEAGSSERRALAGGLMVAARAGAQAHAAIVEAAEALVSKGTGL